MCSVLRYGDGGGTNDSDRALKKGEVVGPASTAAEGAGWAERASTREAAAAVVNGWRRECGE